MCVNVLTSIVDVAAAPLKDYFSNPFKQSPFLSFKRNLSFQSQNIWDNPKPSSAENFGINQDWRPNPLCNVCRCGWRRGRGSKAVSQHAGLVGRTWLTGFYWACLKTRALKHPISDQQIERALVFSQKTVSKKYATHRWDEAPIAFDKRGWKLLLIFSAARLGGRKQKQRNAHLEQTHAKTH